MPEPDQMPARRAADENEDPVTETVKEEAQPESDSPAPSNEPSKLRKFFAFSRAQALVGACLCVVSFALVTQITTTTRVNPYAGMRQDDLVQVLDGLNSESDRLRNEISELERTRDRLRSGADAAQVAAEEAARREAELAILAGTAPATGPGVRFTISAPEGALTSNTLLNAIQELKDAGAEVIEVNDSIRLGTDSWFGDVDGHIVIDDHEVTLPITLDVIGEPHALEEGARFRGGLVSQIESPRIGGAVSIKQLDKVDVDSVRSPRTPEVARPA